MSPLIKARRKHFKKRSKMKKLTEINFSRMSSMRTNSQIRMLLGRRKRRKESIRSNLKDRFDSYRQSNLAVSPHGGNASSGTNHLDVQGRKSSIFHLQSSLKSEFSSPQNELRIKLRRTNEKDQSYRKKRRKRKSVQRKKSDKSSSSSDSKGNVSQSGKSSTQKRFLKYNHFTNSESMMVNSSERLPRNPIQYDKLTQVRFPQLETIPSKKVSKQSIDRGATDTPNFKVLDYKNLEKPSFMKLTIEDGIGKDSTGDSKRSKIVDKDGVVSFTKFKDDAMGSK